MPPKGRHRRPPPRTGAATGTIPAGQEITGKRNTQAKNERYARPLPVQVRGASKTNAGWLWNSFVSLASLFVTPDQADSQTALLVAYWDPTTCSAWVQITPSGQDEAGPSSEPQQQTRTAQELWNAGFFGKGSLSRSEPTWRMRKLNEEKVKRQREKGMKVFTPEELTQMRRRQRMRAKIERARLAVKAGTQLPDGIVALGGTLTEEEEKILARRAEAEVDQEGDEAEEEYGKHIPGLIYLGKGEDKAGGSAIPADSAGANVTPPSTDDPLSDDHITVQEMEWLHVSPVEVFFLAGMLGVLEIRDQQDVPLPLQDIYVQLLQGHVPTSPSLPPDSSIARPDNPFLLSYLAYHHYRSLGWAVKSGIKFCCDWLLYKRGPVFGHAEFAVVIIPVYEDPADAESSPFPPHPAGGDRDWVWFSTMNRVQTQVLKTLVLTHITIPALSRTHSEMLSTPEALVQNLKAGKLHSIKEVSLRRWVPARMRA